jgi:uncharacterized lipoprotein YmbA
VLAAALIGGCTSNAKLRYYSLVPPVESQAPLPVVPAFDLPKVAVTPQADYPELVLRQGSERFAIVENRLWVSPLPDEIRAALLARLSVVAPPGSTSSRPATRADVEITRFDSVLDQYALVEARWRLKSGDVVLSCATRSVQNVDSGYTALVAGHQRNIVALADAIAAGLATLTAETPQCPRG